MWRKGLAAKTVIVLVLAALLTAILVTAVIGVQSAQRGQQNHLILRQIQDEQHRVDVAIAKAGTSATGALAKAQLEILDDLQAICVATHAHCG